MRRIKSFNESTSAKEDNPIHYSELQDLCDKYYALPYSDKERKKHVLDEFVELFGTVFGDINHSIQHWLRDDDAKRLIKMFNQGGFAFHVEKFKIDLKNSQHTEKLNEFLMDGWSTLSGAIFRNDYEVIFYKKTNLYKVHQNSNLRELNKKTGLFESKSTKLTKETTIPIKGSKYSLNFWIDDEYEEDGEVWSLSFLNSEDDMDGLTFACEDPDDGNEVVINDFGVIQEQYMNDEQLAILKMLKLRIGQKFKNMQSLYTYIQLALSKKVDGLFKTGIFENVSEQEVEWKIEVVKESFQIYLNGYMTFERNPGRPNSATFSKKVFEILFYGSGWKPASEQNEEWNYITHDTVIDKQQYGEWTQFKTLEEVIMSFNKKGIIIPRNLIEEYKERITRAIFGNFIDSEKIMSMNQKTGIYEKLGPLVSDFSVFENLIMEWKKVYLKCIDVANKYGYEVIQERLDPNYTFKIRVILECADDADFNIDRFHKLYEEIDSMKSVNIDELGKRIQSMCNTDKFDITAIDKSKKLKHLKKTGIFENSKELLNKIVQKFDNLKAYPYIDIYID